MLFEPLIRLNQLLYFWNLRVYMFLYKWSSYSLKKNLPKTKPRKINKKKISDWDDLSQVEFSVKVIEN